MTHMFHFSLGRLYLLGSQTNNTPLLPSISLATGLLGFPIDSPSVVACDLSAAGLYSTSVGL